MCGGEGGEMFEFPISSLVMTREFYSGYSHTHLVYILLNLRRVKFQNRSEENM